MNKNKTETKTKEACEQSDKKTKVTGILSGVVYPTDKDREYAIDSFVNCRLNITEIEKIVESLKPDHNIKVESRSHNNSNRQVDRRGMF